MKRARNINRSVYRSKDKDYHEFEGTTKKSAHPWGCKDFRKYDSVVLETKSLRYNSLTPLQNYDFSTFPNTIGNKKSCLTRWMVGFYVFSESRTFILLCRMHKSILLTTFYCCLANFLRSKRRTKGRPNGTKAITTNNLPLVSANNHRIHLQDNLITYCSDTTKTKLLFRVRKS